MQEARDEDVGVRPVVLLAAETFAGRGDAKPAALLVVEDRGEDAGRVEARKAQPVDRAVHADQRRRPQVADQPVVFDRLIRHSRATPADPRRATPSTKTITPGYDSGQSRGLQT